MHKEDDGMKQKNSSNPLCGGDEIGERVADEKQLPTSQYDLDIEEVDNLIKASDAAKQTAEVQNQDDLRSELAFRQKMRDEQVKRTVQITRLLTNYRGQQSQREESKQKLKNILVWALIVFSSCIILLLAVWSITFICLHDDLDGINVVALISAFVTCFGSVLSILIVIVRYVFPQDENKYFNDLVKSIISNDTERIKDENEYRLKKDKKD